MENIQLQCSAGQMLTFEMVTEMQILRLSQHLEEAISNIVLLANEYILISVPVIGDPNLANDNTHIIKETKDWWVQKFLGQNGVLTNSIIEQVDVPEHFLFRDQLLIFKKVIG